MKTINEASLKGKKVLIRVDFNLPLDNNLNITDDSRMTASLPTIKKVIESGGRAIILSHLGRPKYGFEDKYSLKHLVKRLSDLLKTNVLFSNDCIGIKTSEDIDKMKNSQVIILENLRFYSEETSGGKLFAEKLSQLGDLYINDAFGTAHRNHASTSILPSFFPQKKYFGLLLTQEILSLKRVLYKPKRPFTAIIGGAKISGKIDVISSLFDKVDNMIIGGGMAYTFIKAMGGEIGSSIFEEEKVVLAKKLINDAKNKNVNLILPTDSLNAESFHNKANVKKSNILEISHNYMGMDIGPASIKKFSKIISLSKTIIWNGPMGVFEMENFECGTKKIAEAVSHSTEQGAFSLIGGGDSIAAAKKFKVLDKVSYISTGGGAMLKYLEGGLLPAVSAIMD